MMRKPMIDAALNRNCSRPDAESSSASTRAGHHHHRAAEGELHPPPVSDASDDVDELEAMVHVWALPKGQISTRRGGRDPKRVALRTFHTESHRLQELLFPRQLIRDDRLDRQQQETRHHQIPPQALAPLGLLARHFLRRGPLLGRRRSRDRSPPRPAPPDPSPRAPTPPGPG